VIFGRGKKKDEEEEFAKSVALTEQQAVMEEEMRASVGSSLYYVYDPHLHAILNQTERDRATYPARSFINRTTNIDAREKEILFNEYEYLNTLSDIGANEEEYETVGWLKGESVLIHDRIALNDMHNGWKGKLMAERVRRIIAELQQRLKKKGRFF